MPESVLAAEGLTVLYPKRGVGAFRQKAVVRALAGVSLRLAEAEAVGVIGASGSGKSSLVTSLACLAPIVSGKIWWLGERVDNLPERRRRPLRRLIQAVFQDPASSFNPKHSVGFALREAAWVGCGGQLGLIPEAIQRSLEVVGLELDKNSFEKRITEFSGGQQHRLSLARALLLKPRALLLDEPVASLDAPLRWSLIRQLGLLSKKVKVAMVLVTHDFTILDGLIDRVVVLLGGHVVEEASWEVVKNVPRHPYTRALQMAAERPMPEGNFVVPPTTGCPFRSACPRAFADCLNMPQPRLLGATRVACHRPLEENTQTKNT